MRILIKARSGQLTIKEIPEAIIAIDGNIAFPKSGEMYLTGECTESIFKSLLTEGYADFSGFERKVCHFNAML